MPETFDLKALEKRMDGALASLKTEFSGLRTGRASIHLLDTIHVVAYGASTPLNQVASVSAVDARSVSQTNRLKGILVILSSSWSAVIKPVRPKISQPCSNCRQPEQVRRTCPRRRLE